MQIYYQTIARFRYTDFDDPDFRAKRRAIQHAVNGLESSYEETDGSTRGCCEHRPVYLRLRISQTLRRCVEGTTRGFDRLIIRLRQRRKNQRQSVKRLLVKVEDERETMRFDCARKLYFSPSNARLGKPVTLGLM